MATLYQGIRNNIPVEKPYSDLDAVKLWTLYEALPGDDLQIEGYPDVIMPMPTYKYDWEVKAWVAGA